MPAMLTRRSGSLLAALAALAAIAALLVWVSVPARAHTELTGTQPADGAELKKPPKQVTLTFAEPPLATGLAVVLQSKSGPQDLPADVRGNAVVAEWPAEASGGQYRVSYRVVAADGHPITGQLSFVVAQTEPQAPSESAAAAPTPTPTTTTAAAEAAAEPSGPAIPYWLWLLGAILVVAAAYVLIARSRRSHDS